MLFPRRSLLRLGLNIGGQLSLVRLELVGKKPDVGVGLAGLEERLPRSMQKRHSDEQNRDGE